MPQDLVVIVGPPGQAADADDELEFLAVVRRIQLYLKQTPVDASHCGVTALAFCPQPPVSHPVLERPCQPRDVRCLLAPTVRRLVTKLADLITASSGSITGIDRVAKLGLAIDIPGRPIDPEL